MSSLELLVRISTLRCFEELFVCLNGEFYVVQFVVRNSREKQNRGRSWEYCTTDLQSLQGLNRIVVG